MADKTVFQKWRRIENIPTQNAEGVYRLLTFLQEMSKGVLQVEMKRH